MKRIRQTAQRLYEIFQRVLDEQNKGRYAPELWSSYGHVGTRAGALRRTLFVSDLCRLAKFDPQDKVIVDAGCGFGVIAIIIHLLGARKVWGCDISEERLTTFQRIIADLRLEAYLEGHLLPVENIPLEDCSVDAVVSNEAISHYRDVDAFVRQAARLLKPGGVLLIADGNNAANLSRRRFTQEIWERFENRPAGEVHGHYLETPYREMRRQIIQATAPQLPEDIVTRIAEGTAYMDRNAVVKAVHHYLATGTLPSSRFDRNRCPLNPISGAYMEMLFHPAELARQIEDYGFRARHYAALGGAIPVPLVGINHLFRLLTPFTLPWARAFRVVAVRV
ncbi:MAG: class I SAM-dependent methyltransferase [Firmicutes bacterium]|nr:class I SAM-dependent methyltransferase [Bacillota bacterium]